MRVAIALYLNGFPNYDVSPSLKIALTLTNSVNPDFVWVFNVCLSTCLGVSSKQRVKNQN